MNLRGSDLNLMVLLDYLVEHRNVTHAALVQSLASELSGEVDLIYVVTGVMCVVTVPLEAEM